MRPAGRDAPCAGPLSLAVGIQGWVFAAVVRYRQITRMLDRFTRKRKERTDGQDQTSTIWMIALLSSPWMRKRRRPVVSCCPIRRRRSRNEARSWRWALANYLTVATEASCPYRSVTKSSSASTVARTSKSMATRSRSSGKATFWPKWLVERVLVAGRYRLVGPVCRGAVQADCSLMTNATHGPCRTSGARI